MPNFADIKATIPIETAAQYLNLQLRKEKKQLRGVCPACPSEDDRMLAITPSIGCFFCHDAKVGGSVIDLAAHILGLPLRDAAQWLEDTMPLSGSSTVPVTRTEVTPAPSPTSASSGAVPAQMLAPFDPTAYAAKLSYTDQVRDLGISEEDAARLGIGFMSTGLHRGRIVFTVRHPTGEIAGFVGVLGNDLKLPQKWIAPQGNVVRFPKSA